MVENLRTVDRVGTLEKPVEQTRAVEDLERGGLDSGSAALLVRTRFLLDEPRLDAVSCELARGEQARRPSADDQDFCRRLAGRGHE